MINYPQMAQMTHNGSASSVDQKFTKISIRKAGNQEVMNRDI
jgi:hypothetical protein